MRPTPRQRDSDRHMADILTGIRILIAEDHDDTRYVVEHVLRYLGATVTAAATAREALSLVPAADIILTDFSMPDHDGVWLLEQVNQHAPNPGHLGERVRREPGAALGAGAVRAQAAEARRSVGPGPADR
jgi:CheY-like chemotaxis protein